ncbi:MAG: tetratricopeptide repeat protein [Chloroflexota bacterium]
MSRILFEQYKDALRRGHVAAARGRLEAAVTWYEAAVAIAPDRALPYTSLGDVLIRLGRHDAAERAYGAALRRSPEDETALRGRATVLLGLHRPLDAALDLERLAEVLEHAGRLPEACDAACAALDIAESRPRREALERIAGQLSELAGDPGAADALVRATRYLGSPGTHAAGLIGDGAGEGSATTIEAPIDAVGARVEAEVLLAAGNTSSARALLLSIAVAEREAGRLDAALDACLIMLTIDPADSAVQLELAANQAARGWTGLAREKVLLLRRLAELDANEADAAAIDAFTRHHGLGPSREGSGSLTRA